MDYALFDNSNLLLSSAAVTIVDSKSNSPTTQHWMPSDSSMDAENDEYFGWNPLKIDEEQQTHNNGEQQQQLQMQNHSRPVRKRKLDVLRCTQNEPKLKLSSLNGYKVMHEAEQEDEDPLAMDEKQEKGKLQTTTSTAMTSPTSTSLQNGVRMPAWQVEDISDLHGDIDSLGSDLANTSYNDAILTISGLTVFKQEAPSPTNNDGGMQVVRRQSPTSSGQQLLVQNNSGQIDDGCSNNNNNNNQSMINSTLNQLLTQSVYTNLQNAIDANLVSSSPNSQDNYNVSSSSYNFTEDCRFQYVLAAATSIATKVNEDTLTYLNQGQSYEIKLKKLGDLSTYRGKSLKTIVRMCFHERRLQYMEKEQMASWQKARPGDRILEVDVPLSYGAFDIVQPQNTLNMIQFNWDPTKEVGVYIKVNCISTEFTPKKHGGEKGVPFRIQVETYQNGDNVDSPNQVRLHAAACQIKVFKLKGADRKHKQDREKIMKRPTSEQEKYQPSYECTVLNDIPIDAVLSSPPPVLQVATNDSSGGASKQQQQQPVRKDSFIEELHKKLVNINKSSSSPPLLNTDNNDAIQHHEVVEEQQLENHLDSNSAPQQTVKWLVENRFDKHLDTFASFSGTDMLRMSREDLIQICGQADGIRLYNCVHLKTIVPKLKIYVCRDNKAIFNAIFLLSYSSSELCAKLAAIMGVAPEQVQGIYIEGPHQIHVHLTNEVVRHIKDETMFTVEIMQENESYVFLLKRAMKKGVL